MSFPWYMTVGLLLVGLASADNDTDMCLQPWDSGPWAMALEEWAVGEPDNHRHGRVMNLPPAPGYYITDRVDQPPPPPLPRPHPHPHPPALAQGPVPYEEWTPPGGKILNRPGAGPPQKEKPFKPSPAYPAQPNQIPPSTHYNPHRGPGLAAQPSSPNPYPSQQHPPLQQYPSQSQQYPSQSQEYPSQSQQNPSQSQQYPSQSQQYPSQSQQYPSQSQQYPSQSQQYPSQSQQYPSQSQQYPSQTQQYPAPSQQPPYPSQQQSPSQQYTPQQQSPRPPPNHLSVDRIDEPPRKQVTETDLYLLTAIEKLVYRVDLMEKRLRKLEENVHYLVAGAEPKPEPCVANFTRVAGTCYHFSEAALDWKSANLACRKLRANLLELDSEEERRKMLATMLGDKRIRGMDVWTGGLNPGLLWIWSHSARPVLANSTTAHGTATGDMANTTVTIVGEGRCLALVHDPAINNYVYRGQDCAFRHRYICEKGEDKAKLSNEIDRVARGLKHTARQARELLFRGEQ